MAWDCWANIEEKLESAERQLQQASRDIINPELPPQYVAMQFTGVEVSDPRWRAKLSSHASTFVVDCRSIPDIIQSCFGEDRRGDKKWLSKLPSGEKERRKQFRQSFERLYVKFSKLPLSRARVDTVHRQGFVDIWVKAGKRYSALRELADTEMKLILAGSDLASQWAATLPPRRARYLPSDFFFKTMGGRYKLLFPECQSYLRRTRELVGSAGKLYETVHSGHKLTKPPRQSLHKSRRGATDQAAAGAVDERNCEGKAETRRGGALF